MAQERERAPTHPDLLSILPPRLQVPNAYFGARPGNAVRLYQGAANSDKHVAPYRMPNGDRWHVRALWEDLYDAIEGAEKFVYVVGWSVHPETRLLRHGEKGENAKHIGELLRSAADRGVDVRSLMLAVCIILFAATEVACAARRCGLCLFQCMMLRPQCAAIACLRKGAYCPSCCNPVCKIIL